MMKTSTHLVDRGYLKRVAALSFEHASWNRKSILEMRDLLSPWSHNIRLPHGIFTTSWDGYYPAHREIMQIVSRQLGGRFRKRRVLDIGCSEGYFSAECALQGASVVAVDGKLINIRKCEFVKSVLGIRTLHVVRDDAMRVTARRYGLFDVVLALGLLYHFDDPARFLKNMAGLCNGFMLLDTHVALTDQPRVLKNGWDPRLSALKKLTFGGRTYTGRLFREHPRGASRALKELSLRASLKNEVSVWLTEDSLVSLLRDVGFEEVSKLVFPREEGSWWSDMRRDARVLMLAVRKRQPFRSKVFAVA